MRKSNFTNFEVLASDPTHLSFLSTTTLIMEETPTPWQSSPDPPPETPLDGDASFGLDPSADVDHHLEGHRWLPEFKDLPRPHFPATVPAHHSRRREHSEQRQTGRSRSRSPSYDSNDAANKPSRPGTMPTRPPTGSLSLSIFTSGISMTRRLSLLASSLFVNAGLPFVNGVMLGTGEIVARAVVVPVLLIGWTWARQRLA